MTKKLLLSQGLAAALALPAVGLAGDVALASFEGGKITTSDLEAAIANKDRVTQARLASPEERKRLLRELVNYDLLALEAEHRGYAKHPAVIDAGRRAAVDALLSAEFEVDPASIPATEVAREFDSQQARVSPPMSKEPRLSDAEGALRTELAARRFREGTSEFAKRLYDRDHPAVHAELVDCVQLEPIAGPDQPRGFPAAPPDPRAPARRAE
jgi:hypothetical protein